MHPEDSIVVGLPQFEIESVDGPETVRLHARYLGALSCPWCQGKELRMKDSFVRVLRHASLGIRPCYLHLQSHKYHCLSCGRYFNQRFPGIGKGRRSTEPFRRQIFQAHHGGISQRTLGERERLGSATVERWYQELLEVKVRERVNDLCPKVLGIDEHHFSRKDGFATTFCNLAKRKVFDVTLGRSEKALEPYLDGLSGKDQVQVVCMDLADHYRSLVRKHFSKALIVADRFHVIRLVNEKFLACWAALDPKGRSNRGLLSLVRRHEANLRPEQRPKLLEYLRAYPAFGDLYVFKQKLCRLLMIKERTKRQCRRLIPYFLRAIERLKAWGLKPLVQLAETFDSWKEEIARMWRFTKNNAITEGFHTKMEMISRRAYGFRNFENYRLRVRVLCG
jgi:Transposase and inactivated derivatives